jgi:hypothetical protein
LPNSLSAIATSCRGCGAPNGNNHPVNLPVVGGADQLGHIRREFVMVHQAQTGHRTAAAAAARTVVASTFAAALNNVFAVFLSGSVLQEALKMDALSEREGAASACSSCQDGKR